jgi:FKBP-type peptidyl-prolyl cis-trans isomerase FklB
MTLKPLFPALLILLFTGCAATKTDTGNSRLSQASAAKGTLTSQNSYELGLLHLKTLREGKFNLDQAAYERGLLDALNGKATDGAPNTQAAWRALSTMSYEEVKTANLALGKAFLEQNKTRKGVVTLPSGVQYEVLQPGKGPHKPTLNDTAGIIYKIAGIDGSVKMDYFVKGNQKMFQIPMQKIVSKGWQEALQLMTISQGNWHSAKRA